MSAQAIGAEQIEPRAPRRELALPTGRQTYCFMLDSDLIKLVTLSPGPGLLNIEVRYAADAVLDEVRHAIALTSRPRVAVDGMGLIVTWRAPLIPRLGWPTMKRTRRF